MRFAQVERFLASGMRVAEWCGLNGVSESVLYRWMSTYRQAELDSERSLSQKCKDTTEWIEVSRAGMAEAVAIVPAAGDPAEGADGPAAPPAAPRVPLDAAARAATARSDAAPAIAVAFPGFTVGIPPGCAEADIGAVLRAAVAL